MRADNDSFNDILEEYRHSRALLRGRIQELNHAIGALRRDNAASGGIKELTERRMKLYAMVWDINLALRMLCGYAPARTPESAVHNERKDFYYAG